MTLHVDEDDHPFDARKIWMSESFEGTGVEGWRAVSLVTALRAVLQDGPAGDDGGPVSEACPDLERRHAFLRLVMNALTARGLDAESLIRYGLAPEVLAPTLGALLVSELLAAGDAGSFEKDRSSIDIEGWRKTLHLDAPVPRAHLDESLRHSGEFESALRKILQESLQGISSALAPVIAWMLQADIDDLISLRPPDQEELVKAVSAAQSFDPGLVAEYRWIVDRFSTTFVNQWATESLHFEYRWVSGLGVPPCPPKLMEERQVQVSDLNAEIAKRAVHAPRQSQSIPRPVYQVATHARAFLRDGRAREAAALYEFVCREEPENSEALNNLGFCLIPEDPERALRYLEAARRFGYKPLVVNVYNRMCCHVALGKPRLAIREAEQYWAEDPDGPRAPAILWVPDADERWSLKDVLSTRDELSSLARYAADCAA